MSVLLCWLALAQALALGSGTLVSGPGNNVNYNNNIDVVQGFLNLGLRRIITNQELPTELLGIRFGVVEALLGNQVCTAVSLYYPFFSFEASARSLNTLICFNPDVGFFFEGSYDLSYLILLVMNIPGENTYKGDLVIDFKAALPPPGAGPTRNVCLVYKQQKEIKISTELLVRVSRDICKFNVTDFAKDYRLGDPYSGNVYLTQLTLCESNGQGCIQNNCNVGNFFLNQ